MQFLRTCRFAAQGQSHIRTKTKLQLKKGLNPQGSLYCMEDISNFILEGLVSYEPSILLTKIKSEATPPPQPLKCNLNSGLLDHIRKLVIGQAIDQS